MKHTSAYHNFMRGVSERRSTLLFREGTRSRIYPERGNDWVPSKRDLANSDAFILFFVAELEYYFEQIISSSLTAYKNVYTSYFLKNCQGGEQFIPKISEYTRQVAKNHNANWSKISSFFLFIGMGKDSHFPYDYWEDIDTIVAHRGHLAHNGARLRLSTDRRDLFRKIELTIKRTNHFDEFFKIWLDEINEEHKRVKILSLEFRPPQSLIVA